MNKRYNEDTRKKVLNEIFSPVKKAAEKKQNKLREIDLLKTRKDKIMNILNLLNDI